MTRYFNSIKVQLRRDMSLRSKRNTYNFNSIKVQLRRLFLNRKKDTKIFQFHKGTIKTTTSCYV